MIDELLTYSLTDFLMFTSRTYARLFELYNRTLWPIHVPVALSIFWVIFATRSPDALRARLVSLLLAAFWGVIAWQFFLQHYATINTAAPVFALGFVVQALLIFAIGALAGRVQYAWSGRRAGKIGLAVLLLAVLLVPITNLLSGRSWQGIELFGLTPDPTALGTIGLVLMARGKPRWLLLPIPLLWCVITVLTHVAMALKG